MSLLDPTFDGHTHTPWCPHGSDRPLHEYLDRALELGLRRYAVTEHMPLPTGFVDPIAPRECAGLPEELGPCLAEVEAHRQAYAGRLEVLVGLEVDYYGAAQGGWHGEALRLLASVWDRLDPEATLLSLHFLGDGIVDGSSDRQVGLIPPGGCIDEVHLRYYAVLTSALQASWTWGGVDLRPRRIGHLTLPRKFIRALPLRDPARVTAAALDVLELIAAEGLALDVNTAGLDKPGCGEIYLPEPLLARAVELKIPLVLGSDAHHPREVGRHFETAVAAVHAVAGARS